MFNPINKWVVKVRKSYIELYFEFNTAEGAHDFYEVLRDAYVEDKRDDSEYDVSVKIYAECEKDKEEGESE